MTHATNQTLVQTIRRAWGWCGIDPVEVVGENDFGNLMIKDATGRYWRLCPEDLRCTVVAQTREQLDDLAKDQGFLRDWNMSALVDDASKKLGVLPEGRKYCLKIPGPLGGEYGGSNLATIALDDLILASGDIAHQLKDVPDGARVQLRITE